MKKILIKNATLINEGYAGIASVLIEGDKIAAVYPKSVPSKWSVMRMRL